VIDMVEAYLQPGSPLYAGIEAAVDSAARLAAAARAAGVPVIFTDVVSARRRGWRRVLPQGACAEGVRAGLAAWSLPAVLSPEPGDLVITKRYASAFFATRYRRDADVDGRRHTDDHRRFNLRLRARNRARCLPERVPALRGARCLRRPAPWPARGQLCSIFRPSTPKSFPNKLQCAHLQALQAD